MGGGHTPDRNPTALKNNLPPPSNLTFPTALRAVLLLDQATLPPQPLFIRSCFLLLVYFGQNGQLVLLDTSRREVGYRSRIWGL
jgi:hypothetical protein